MLGYAVKITKDSQGYAVRFPAFPEAVTYVDRQEDVVAQAVDCLEEALAARIADELPSLPAEKLAPGLGKVLLDAVHMGSEALDVAGGYHAAPVATGRAAVLEHRVAHEGSGEDPAVHQDAVDLDEILRKGSHDWSRSIHLPGVGQTEKSARRAPSR